MRGKRWLTPLFAALVMFVGCSRRYYRDFADRWQRFLDTAQRCADFYIARTPAHGVPPNDWDEPLPIIPYESSAAAIAASEDRVSGNALATTAATSTIAIRIA